MQGTISDYSPTYLSQIASFSLKQMQFVDYRNSPHLTSRQTQDGGKKHGYRISTGSISVFRQAQYPYFDGLSMPDGPG